MPEPLLSPEELAVRWKVTPLTLAYWRWHGKGPRFTKIGRHPFYRVQDIERFEEEKSRHSTTDIPEEIEEIKTTLNSKLKNRRKQK